MKNTLKDAYLEIQERLKNCEPFSTGFEDLDIFCQFIDKGSIITVGGRPAMGKTSFAISLANHLLSVNKKVLYFSLDLSKEKLIYRLVANKIKYPLFYLLNNKIDVKELDSAFDFYEDKEIFIENKTRCIIDELEAKIEEIKPAVVFIDYVQLLEMPKAPNLTEAVNLAIHEIKRIAQETGTIIILLSQLSRALESRGDHRPILSDLRNGSLLEELSDVVLMIYREDYYDATTDNKKAEIIVLKNSMGQVGSIYLNFENGHFENYVIDEEF